MFLITGIIEGCNANVGRKGFNSEWVDKQRKRKQSNKKTWTWRVKKAIWGDELIYHTAWEECNKTQWSFDCFQKRGGQRRLELQWG